MFEWGNTNHLDVQIENYVRSAQTAWSLDHAVLSGVDVMSPVEGRPSEIFSIPDVSGGVMQSLRGSI